MSENAAENDVDDGNKIKGKPEIKTEAKYSEKLANSDKNMKKDPSNKECLKYNDDIIMADQSAKNKDIVVKSAETHNEKPAGISEKSSENHQSDHDFPADNDSYFDDNSTEIDLMDSTFDEIETSHDNKDSYNSFILYDTTRKKKPGCRALIVTGGLPLNIPGVQLQHIFKKHIPRPSYVNRDDLKSPTCKIHFKNPEDCEIAYKFLRKHQIFTGGPMNVEYLTAGAEAKMRDIEHDPKFQAYHMVNYNSTSIIALENVEPKLTVFYHITPMIQRHIDFNGDYFIYRYRKKCNVVKIYFRNNQDCFTMYEKLKGFKKLGDQVIIKLESKPGQFHAKANNTVQVIGFPPTWGATQIKAIIKKHSNYNGTAWIEPVVAKDMSKFIMTLESVEEACSLKEKMEWFTINGRKIAISFHTDPEDDRVNQTSTKRSYNENGSQEGDSEKPAFKKLKPAENSTTSPSPVKETPSTSNVDQNIQLNTSNLFKQSNVCGKQLNVYDETFGISPAYLYELGISLPLVQRICVRNVNRFVTQDHEEDLRKVFSLAGRVTHISVRNNHTPRKDWTSINVDYEHPVEAVQAVALFNKQILCGCEMTVKMDRIGSQIITFLPPGLESIGFGFGPEGRPLPNIAQYINQQPLKVAFQDLGMKVTFDFDSCNFFDSRQIRKSIEMIQPGTSLNKNQQKDTSNQPQFSSGAAVTTSQVQNSDPSTAMQAQLITMMQNMQNMLKTIPKQNIQTTGQVAPQPTLGQQNPYNEAGGQQKFAQNNHSTSSFSPNLAQGVENWSSVGSNSNALSVANLPQNVYNMPTFNSNLPPPVQTALSTSSNLGQNVQNPSFSPNVLAASPFDPSVVQNATNTPSYGSNLAQNMQLNASQPYYVKSQASITPDQSYFAQNQASITPDQSYFAKNQPSITPNQPYFAQNQNPCTAGVVPPQPIGKPPQEPPKQFYKPVLDDKVQSEWNTIGQPVTYNQQKKEYSQVPPPKPTEPPKSCREFLVFSRLPPSVTPEALSTKMRQVGELVFCEAAGPGRALVRFKHESDADRCIKLFDNSKVDGKVINVKRM